MFSYKVAVLLYCFTMSANSLILNPSKFALDIVRISTFSVRTFDNVLRTLFIEGSRTLNSAQRRACSFSQP